MIKGLGEAKTLGDYKKIEGEIDANISNFKGLKQERRVNVFELFNKLEPLKQKNNSLYYLKERNGHDKTTRQTMAVKGETLHIDSPASPSKTSSRLSMAVIK